MAYWSSRDELDLSRHRTPADASRTAGVRGRHLRAEGRHGDLFPPLRSVQHDYEHNFQGMTAEPVPLDALLVARERIVRELQHGLDDDERTFLQSLVAGAPDWSLLNIAHLEHLPGIRWKLHNLAQLQKTNAKKFAEQAELLSTLFAAAVPGTTAEPTSGAE
jgi:hypothetical protein